MSDHEPWIDVDGDGRADPVTEVHNPDGSVTYEHFDAQGHLDFVGVSEHGDGHVDYADYDSDHDGHFDTRLAASSPDGYLDHEVHGVDFSHDDALAAEYEHGTGHDHTAGHAAAGPTLGGSVGGHGSAPHHEPAAGPTLGGPVGGHHETPGAEPAYGVGLGENVSPYGS
ncbi:hypothetical protein [Actinocatenispora rupis]|uniref:Uncharacterized protein n=1 Tax=Actinocatenispora rupis TaxID=519421 RepID=A0A8J3JG29_9ACTN|nr:hypothetical protein [Actinocatenispora rupis]GID14238.1 hypothetical protein Aru02nite_51270 [Actinocatenispora rupis]